MFVLPADHVVTDEESFRRSLRAAAAAAESDCLLTLGISPSRPETGYGYLEIGDELGTHEGLEVRRVLSFVEKPSREKAKALVGGGRHLWNSGIFIWRVARIIRELEEHLPEMTRALSVLDPDTLIGGGDKLDGVYRDLPSVSVDYGVMEKAHDIRAVPSSFGWNDLGSWLALDEIWPADAAGNRVRGELLALSSQGITCYGGERMVAAVGVEDLIIVDTPDALLVCSKDASQMVRQLADQLESSGRKELL
jgi:mannose-1-phosphate guanylyltransferase